MTAHPADSERAIDRDLAHELERLAAVADRDDPVSADDLAALRTRLDAAVAAETGVLARLRARPTSQRVALVVLITAATVVAAALASPRGDLTTFPVVRTVALIAVLGVATAAATLRLLRPLHRPPPGATSDRILLLLAALAPVVAALALAQGYDGSPPGEGLVFAQRCAGCAAFGGVLAVPILLFATVLRRARVDGPAVAALAGVAAGIGALLVLHVHCPVTSAAHILVAHVALVPVFALLAIVLRRRS